MALNALNQNYLNSKFSSFMTTLFGQVANNVNMNNSYYAKKGEPMYMAEMDSDGDGVVSLDEF